MHKKVVFFITGTFLLVVSVSVLLLVADIPSGSDLKDDLALQSEAVKYVPSEILVKFKEYPTGDIVQSRALIENVINSVQGKIKTFHNNEVYTFNWNPSVFSQRSFIGDPYLFRIKIPEGIDIDYAVSNLKVIPYIEYVEKHGVARMCSTEPNDPEFYRQWALQNICAPEAWDISTGNPEVVVAVIDSGVDWSHEDLAADIWTNPNETVNGYDDDGNDLVDDIHGWDFYNNDNEPEDFYRLDCSNPWHGTSVAGIIGAVGDNGEGISGICWNVKIMPVKVWHQCDWPIANFINGVDYATMQGAFILSNSWLCANSSAMLEAIARAGKKSKLFVCASGNDNTDIEKIHRWPSFWTLENILSVLGTTDYDNKTQVSNYGKLSVDIGAPGENILTTKGDPIYKYNPFSGTSAAAPHVSGVAALALGVCPGLTSNRLKNLIIQNDDNREALENLCVSGGRVNANKVLDGLGGSYPPNAPSNLVAYPTAWNTIRLVWADNSYNELGFEIQRRDDHQTYFIHDNCADMNSTSMAVFRDESIDTTEQRTHYYRIRSTNGAGISAFSNTVSASIPYTVPNSPTDLQGQTPTFPPLVEIYWSDIAVNEKYFFVERRISGYGWWEQIATLGGDVNIYNDPDAMPGNTYDYRVRAWNPLGYSGYSNIKTIEVIAY